MIERFNEVKSLLENEEIVHKVLLDEDFIPPHKSAAFVPYDCIVCVTPLYENWITSGNAEFNEKELVEYIESNIEKVNYEKIISATENKTSEPGDFLVYISLESFEEYKSRW
jgi:biotin synthase-related radical SAM superfamily protein